MDEYGMRDSEGHERSALQSSQQSAIASDGLRLNECQILNLDAFLSPNLEPSREFEYRQMSAVYYLEQYLDNTALRDLNVMENILLCTQENQKVQPQPLSSTAAFW
ncbi:hypothetical protein FCULG_00012758 [Fusarium culmorum]|uniref:Uncharacterized protein n=1 Tax=Fusarium culmorum TaxID=5516 RepID=A0A2T4GCC2_FUSCU|nr:hypothetical protein FCULG_00012758 [Fusarium culmorum]